MSPATSRETDGFDTALPCLIGKCGLRWFFRLTTNSSSESDNPFLQSVEICKLSLEAGEMLFVKNCNERKDAIEARKIYVSAISLLCLLNWLYKPIREKIFVRETNRIKSNNTTSSS